ncbi:hypothetical protein F909_02072 [Acinetobacter sp. ANC 3929]|uniref:hypothetical protein n=1 Tax=unclassified Acinetobacter TaxID=196816 RepID=UPI0002CFF708|nr:MULTISPECIES: hypothetical protein [unclassified Acinetobacter]ENW80784.1 hypothetical protein F909_02072 [Acinetobacter sp. ANC 3929]MCH7352208.1 hypothetical protein [Acinetobacter sp. NIPH 2023]MCH7354261.1 hypothetical protein [Acinetobacter sp. NIPH 1958]MCH7358750.1 hypothetical protein [Acinetobacter sp. NIPH 2024]
MFFHASIQWFAVLNVFILCGLLFTQESKAGPLINTDDVSITTAQHCQLESTYRYNKDRTWSYQVVPACNLTQNLEVSLGYHSSKDIDQIHGFSAQAKSILKPMDNDWGVASSLLLSRDDVLHHGGDLDWFFNVPVSFQLLDQRLALDTNVGYQHADERLLRWGVASTYTVSERVGLTLETYNQDRQAPFFQTAVQYSLIPNILTLEASFGDRLHRLKQHWFGLGISYTLSS